MIRTIAAVLGISAGILVQDVQVVGGYVGDVVQVLLAGIDTEDSFSCAAWTKIKSSISLRQPKRK